MPTHPKLCTDCRHCDNLPELNTDQFRCNSKDTLTTSLVNGKVTTKNCESARWSPCGPDAKFFEAKEGAR